MLGNIRGADIDVFFFFFFWCLKAPNDHDHTVVA